MNSELILHKIADIFIQCRIHSFPIDCFAVIEQCGLVCRKYSDQNPQNLAYCHVVSDDAFSLKNIIFYNDSLIERRVRFSLMHELGHHILGHKDHTSPSQENEANFFASNILAPRIVISHAECQTPAELSNRFGITAKAARYAWNDYRRWMKSDRRPEADRRLYQHFSDPVSGIFIYQIHPCRSCRLPVINSDDPFCPRCSSASQRTALQNYGV